MGGTCKIRGMSHHFAPVLAFGHCNLTSAFKGVRKIKPKNFYKNSKDFSNFSPAMDKNGLCHKKWFLDLKRFLYYLWKVRVEIDKVQSALI